MDVAVHTDRGKTREYQNVVKAITEGEDVHITRLFDGEKEEFTLRGDIFYVIDEEYNE